MRITFLMLLWLTPMVLLAESAADEALTYRVTYQGLLSAMRPVAIADASLFTRQAGELQVSTLHLSSAAHGMVDALYPIRYRLRSVYVLARQQLLAVERYKRGRKFKHDLVWVDAQDGLVHYRRSSGEGAVVDTPAVFKRWLSDTRFRAVAQAPITSVPGLLDRLTLLQQLRQRESTDGRPWTAVLTDGLKQYRYEITSLGLESLAMEEGPRDSLHLRVQGWEMLPNGEPATEPEHPPIDVWLSRDAQRVPLRLRIDHAVGVFSVDLVDAVTPVEVVIEPPPEAALVASSGVD